MHQRHMRLTKRAHGCSLQKSTPSETDLTTTGDIELLMGQPALLMANYAYNDDVASVTARLSIEDADTDAQGDVETCGYQIHSGAQLCPWRTTSLLDR